MSRHSIVAEQRGLRPGDVARALALASVPLALVVSDGPSAAAMALAAFGAGIVRLAGMRPIPDIVTQAVLVGAAWCAALDLYDAIPWLDLAVHLASGVVLALLCHALLVRSGMLQEGDRRRDGWARVLHVTNAVLLLGLLWELGEWAGHVGIDAGIGVGYEDTLSDLVADLLGALAAAAALERRALLGRGRRS